MLERDLQNTTSRLLQLALDLGALRYGDFTLTSGKKSTYYFDGRLLSLHPEGAYLTAHALLPVVRASGAKAIGGPTLGADPIVARRFQWPATWSQLEARRFPPSLCARRPRNTAWATRWRGIWKPEVMLRWWTTPAPPADPCSRPSRPPKPPVAAWVKVLAILDRREGRQRGNKAARLRFCVAAGGQRQGGD